MTEMPRFVVHSSPEGYVVAKALNGNLIGPVFDTEAEAQEYADKLEQTYPTLPYSLQGKFRR